MKTRLLMEMPEALSDVRTVNVTAVAVLPEAHYQDFLEHQWLPDWALERMDKYTDLKTKGTRITGYNAMLVTSDYGKHGAAVCGHKSVEYAGHFHDARTWLDQHVKRIADYVAEYVYTPGRIKNEMNMQFGHLNMLFNTGITADNGIAELLAAELRERNEIAEIIMHEDCFEINYALDYGQNPIKSGADFLTLTELIGCNLHDVHLLHDSEEHDLATIVELTPSTLTEQGKTDWADVLGAKVENISDGYYGLQVDLSGCKPERLRDFSYLLAGEYSLSDTKKWLSEGYFDTPDEAEGEDTGMSLS
jgi:hypothetical protein